MFIAKFNSLLARLLLYLCTLLSLVCKEPTWAQDAGLKINYVQSTELESIGTVFKIKADDLGLIWIVGSNGLARYNGYSVELFAHQEHDPNSLSTNSATDILMGREGKVWIATYWGLNLYDPKAGQFTRYNFDPKANSPSSNAITCLTQDAKGNIWFGTYAGGLNRLDTATRQFTHYHVNDGLAGETIKSIHADRYGYLWLGYDTQGLDYVPLEAGVTANTVKHIHPSHHPNANTQVDGIAEDAAGNIWTSGNGGIDKIHRANFHSESFNGKESSKNGFKSLGANRIFVDSTDTVWAAGTDKKIYRYNKINADFDEVTQVDASVTTAIGEDASGGIWFGFDKAGIAKLDRYANSIKVLRHSPYDPTSLDSSNVNALALYDSNQLLVGTEEGLNQVNLTDYSVHHFESKMDAQGRGVDAIALDGPTIWIGNSWWGLKKCSLKDACISAYTADNKNSGLNNSEIWSLLVDSHHTLWAGAHRGWLHTLNVDAGQFTAFEINPGKVTSRITALFEDSKGGIWVGADNGLFHKPRNSEGFIHYDNQNTHTISPKFQSILTIYEDSKGQIWFASDGGGVYVWNPKQDTFKNFTQADGLAHNRASGIVEDEHKDIWISTAGGISRFNPTDNVFRNYTVEHGIAGNYHQRSTAIRLPLDRLAFGSTNGLTLVYPSQLYSNQFKANIVLTDIKILNKSIKDKTPTAEEAKYQPLRPDISLTKKIVLNHNQTVFSLDYALLNFDIPQANHYTHRLEGFDKDWIATGTNHSSTYTNLDPGTYLFRVKGANNENLWSDQEAQLVIEVLPPWWKTWWAYGIYLLMALSIPAAIILYLIHKRQKAEAFSRQLEVLVDERTQEIKEKSLNIHTMLNTMQLGLFTVDKCGNITKDYSVYLEAIFDTHNIHNRRALDLLFTNSLLSQDTINQTKNCIESIIGEDHINYDLNCHLLITQYQTMSANNEVKHLELTWNPIINGDGLATHLMVTVRDKTQIIALEHETAEKKRELDVIHTLTKINKSVFTTYYQNAKDQVNFVRNQSSSQSLQFASKRTSILRALHTLKGNARMLGMFEISNLAHESETLIELFSLTPTDPTLHLQLSEKIACIDRHLDDYKQVSTNLFYDQNTPQQSDDLISFDEIKEHLPHLKNDPLFNNLLRSRAFTTLGSLLQPIVESLPEIAFYLKKPTPKVFIERDSIPIHRSIATTLSDVFMHLFRNSLDHGIEPPEERERTGKNPTGTLYVSPTTAADGSLDIVIGDDGRGLDFSKIHTIIAASGQDYASLSDLEQAEFIFEAGVSTKTEITDISGRGIGLSAVKCALKEKNCDVSLRLEDTEPNIQQRKFKLVVTLPGRLFLDVYN